MPGTRLAPDGADGRGVTIADDPPNGDDDHPTTLPVSDAGRNGGRAGTAPTEDLLTATAAPRPDRRTTSRSEPSDRRRTTRGEDDLAWLRIILGTSDAPGERGEAELLARPSIDELRLLLPTGPPAAAASALRRFDDDRDLRTIAAGVAGRALARVGLLRFVPGERIALPRFALVDELARALGEPALVASITVGTRRRNRKPVLQLLTPSGRIVGYAKVGWSPLSRRLVVREADALSRAEGRLPAWLRAPVVLHRQPWLGGVVVVTSPLVPSSRLGALLPRRPAGSARSRPRDAGIPAIVHAIAASEAGVARVGELELFAEWADVGLATAVDLQAVRAQHRDITIATGLWHGDLTPWNLSARPSSVTVWDWEFAGRGRPIGFDALHHEFERHRRRPGGSNRAALAATIADAADILASLGVAGGPDRAATVDAIVDLYLCELVAREIQLDGQRWQGEAVAGLGVAASGILDHRRARWR